MSAGCDAVIISRTQVYPRPARPGSAWRWVYTVSVPGQPHTFSGENLRWARALAKRFAPDLAVHLEWVK